jgi:hypothetical protein
MIAKTLTQEIIAMARIAMQRFFGFHLHGGQTKMENISCFLDFAGLFLRECMSAYFGAY